MKKHNELLMMDDGTGNGFEARIKVRDKALIGALVTILAGGGGYGGTQIAQAEQSASIAGAMARADATSIRVEDVQRSLGAQIQAVQAQVAALAGQMEQRNREDAVARANLAERLGDIGATLRAMARQLERLEEVRR